jgi:hypothetical protein
LLKNGAPRVAFLAYLRDLHEDLAYPELCADGEGGELYAFRGQVFRKISVLDVETFGPDLFNALPGQQADLPDIRSGMGIMLDAEILDEKSAPDVRFFLSFLIGDVDC